MHWDRRLDAQLAAALMGIQAIKGVEVGDGFLTTRRGSAATACTSPTGASSARATAPAAPRAACRPAPCQRVRAGMKPIATVPHALPTVDVATGEPAPAHHQRSDVCAVPPRASSPRRWSRSLANAVLEKFGGDSVAETRRNVEGYLAAIPDALASEVAASDAVRA